MAAGKFRWALHVVDTKQNFFEIDVKPELTPELKIKKLIFRGGVVPKGSTLRSTLYIGYERYRVTWTSGHGKDLLASVTGPFQEFLLKSHLYGPGWQQRALVDRLERQTREIQYNAWWVLPQDQFGGRSPDELAKLKDGAYEIAGQGFLWLGVDGNEGRMVQFHPFFETDSVNDRVRWYLEHCASLTEGIALEIRQSERINLQMIAGFATAFASRPSIGSGDTWAKVADTMGVLTSNDKFPAPSTRHALQKAVDAFSQHPDEARIRNLEKNASIPISKLSATK